MPRRSIAVPSRWARAASFVFLRCTARNPSERQRVLYGSLLCRRPRPSSSPSGTRLNGERRFAPLAGRPSVTRLFGLDEIAARGVDVRHNLERDGRTPLLGARAGCGDQQTALRRRRLRRRLCIGSRLLAAGQRRRRDLLDGRHRRHPADLAEAGRPRPAAAGLRLDRAAGATRATPGRARCAISTERALARRPGVVAYSENEAGWLREWLGAGGPPVVFVPFGVDVNVFRPVEAEPDADVAVRRRGSRGATSSCCSRSRSAIRS